MRLPPNSFVVLLGGANAGGGSVASQAEVNAGTEAAKFVVPSTLFGRERTQFVGRAVTGSTSTHGIERFRFGGTTGISGLSGTWLDRGGAKDWVFNTGNTDFAASSGTHNGKTCSDATMTIGYNVQSNGSPNTEVQWGMGMEARYLDAQSSISSEWYLFWKSPASGSNYIDIRPIQINLLHGDTDSGSPGDNTPYGVFCTANLEVLRIASTASRTATSSGGTSVAGPTFEIDLRAETADWSSIHQQCGGMTYNGPQFWGGGGSCFGPLFKSYRGTAVILGTSSLSDPAPPGYTTQNVFYQSGGSAWAGSGDAFADAVLNFRSDAPSGGETAVQFYRTSTEIMRFGSHTNVSGGVFKNNPWQGFYLDIQTDGARRALRTRFSLDSGSTFTQTTSFTEKGLYIGGDSGAGSMAFTGGSNILSIDDGSAPSDSPANLVLYASSKVLKGKDNAGRTITYGQRTATATLDYGSIAAAASADLTITVTGAATGQAVDLGLPTAPTAGIVFNAFVSATDTVTVRATNITGSPIDPASATYRATVLLN